MNVLIVEDDKQQIENLKNILYESDKNLNIYEAQGKNQALDICNRITIDFFYIDITLQDSSGLDFAFELRKIKKYEFSWIVFITTHMQYIIQAFKEIHCYDYIIKPYEKNEVLELTTKLISGTRKVNVPANERKYVVFEINKGISVKIYIDEIIFIEVKIRTCFIHTKKGEYEIKGLALKKSLELIDCEDIKQCHKSFAVNINCIKKIESISSKLSDIYFEDYDEKAFLGYKFKNIIMEKFK